MDKMLAMIGVLLALMLVPLAHAANDNTPQLLAASAAEAQCRAQYTTAVITSITTNVPGAAGISSYPATLSTDATQLQTLAAAGNRTVYQDYMKSTFNNDIRSANAAIKDARKGFKGLNVTKAARTQMQSDFKTAQQAFQSCQFSATKQYGTLKVQAYTSILSGYQSTVDNLKAKFGIDTTALDAVITGAQTQIITPLQTAIDSATDGKMLGDAMRSYCIYNGCSNGTNYHLAAKFEVERLHDLLGYYTPKWNLTQDQVTSVQSKLDAASAALSAIDPHQYTDEARSGVWDNIKSAAQTLRSFEPQKTKPATTTGTTTGVTQ